MKHDHLSTFLRTIWTTCFSSWGLLKNMCLCTFGSATTKAFAELKCQHFTEQLTLAHKFNNLLACLLCFPCPSSSFICDHGIPSIFLSSEDRPHIGHCTAGKAAFLPTKLLIRSSTLTVVLLLGLWAGSQLAYQAPPGGGLTRKQQHGNIRNKDKLDGALDQLVENWKGRWQNNLKMKNCVWSGLTWLSWLSTEV